MDNKFYITTPIYYVNDVPHIGHTVTTVVADIIARYQKLLGKKVFFLTGTDEHGAKVAQAAEKEKLTPKDFCDKVAKVFENIWPKLNIGFDYFIRTTDPRHEKEVSGLLEKIYQNGDIYRAKYEGLYCVGCEKFITETEIKNGSCPYHPNKPLEKQSEENWFFKLKKYVPTLIEAIENPNHSSHYEIKPESKKTEVLARLKAGVNDISISRSEVSWGIPIPWDKTQTVYVWVDALMNYYSALKINKNEEFWPADIHLVGKEILWFHAVVWEALLLSACLPLPKLIYAHSFYTIDGQKMSKSLGNVISPQQLLEKYGVDGTRYLLTTSFPSLEDSDVGLEKFTKKYNADLANGLGNLVSRVAKLAENSGMEFPLKNNNEIFRKVQKEVIEDFRFDLALNNIWSTDVSAIDKHINQETPWTKSGDQLQQILQYEIDEIRTLAKKLKPFLPDTAEKIEEQFKGPKIKSSTPLFPRI